MKTKRTEKERSVLFKRTEKYAKNVPFFLKERKRTRERFILLEKEWENVQFFFEIYIEIYIDTVGAESISFFSEN